MLTIHPDLTETIHFTLHANDSFGLRQGLEIEAEHHFSYRARCQTEVLLLLLSEWQQLLKYFPDIRTEIYHRLQSLPSENVKVEPVDDAAESAGEDAVKDTPQDTSKPKDK